MRGGCTDGAQRHRFTADGADRVRVEKNTAAASVPKTAAGRISRARRRGQLPPHRNGPALTLLLAADLQVEAVQAALIDSR